MTTKKHYNYSMVLAKVSQDLSEKNKAIDNECHTDHICKNCNKKYKHPYSLSKHIRYRCKKTDDEDLKDLVIKLIKNVEKYSQEVDAWNKEMRAHNKKTDELNRKVSLFMSNHEIIVDYE